MEEGRSSKTLLFCLLLIIFFMALAWRFSSPKNKVSHSLSAGSIALALSSILWQREGGYDAMGYGLTGLATM